MPDEPGTGAEPLSASPPSQSAPDPGPVRVVHHVEISTGTIVRLVAVILATLVALWALDRAASLVGMLVVSVFFALALVPGVNHLHQRLGWRRGAAVGVIYAAGAAAVLAMVGLLIPAIADFADRVDESGAQWLDDLDAWLSDTLGVDLFDGSDAAAASSETAASVEQWSDEAFGGLLSVASSGVGLIFSLATIAMFTFYFAADFPRLQRSFLSWFRPELQQRLGWTIDEAILQTGGYFYSRLLLMVVNGIGFLVTMLLVGVDLSLAIPLALFGSFVSVFIPAVGTYIGGAVPILLTLAVEGLGPALIVLGYVVVYQQVENYWLSPRLSSETMTLNGGLAFGAALGGGALFGPMGAFMALPVTALIVSFITNYRHGYEVAYASSFDGGDPAPASERGGGRHRRTRQGDDPPGASPGTDS